MAEKLCELKKKGGGGGKYTETSLWTNSAPTSNFASQNITLSDSIGNYKYIGIKYRRTTSVTDSITEIILVSEFRLATDVSYTYHIGLGGNNANSYTRRCIYQSDTAIGFSNAARIGTSGTDNSMNIPLEILGLNELDHGTVQTATGTFVTSGSVITNYTVTTGFRPKYIAIYFNGSSGSSSSAAAGAVRYIYDASNPSYGYRSYIGGSGSATDMAPVNESGDTRISAITDTGFVWRKAAGASYNGTYTYFAIGEVSS